MFVIIAARPCTAHAPNEAGLLWIPDRAARCHGWPKAYKDQGQLCPAASRSQPLKAKLSFSTQIVKSGTFMEQIKQFVI